MMTRLGGERAFCAEESRAAECERRRARAARWAGSGGREQDVATRPYIEDYHAPHHDKSRMMQGGHGDLFGGDLDLFLFVLSKSIASLSSLGLFAVTVLWLLRFDLLAPGTRYAVSSAAIALGNATHRRLAATTWRPRCPPVPTSCFVLLSAATVVLPAALARAIATMPRPITTRASVSFHRRWGPRRRLE